VSMWHLKRAVFRNIFSDGDVAWSVTPSLVVVSSQATVAECASLESVIGADVA
jgi:hypothetical protein